MKKINGCTVFDFDTPCNVEPYNSNNAWGFGGSYGLKYVFSEQLHCIIGKACTRHRGEFPHITVWNRGRMDFDETDTKKNRGEAKERIHEILKQTT